MSCERRGTARETNSHTPQTSGALRERPYLAKATEVIPVGQVNSTVSTPSGVLATVPQA